MYLAVLGEISIIECVRYGLKQGTPLEKTLWATYVQKFIFIYFVADYWNPIFWKADESAIWAAMTKDGGIRWKLSTKSNFSRAMVINSVNYY